MKTKNVIFTVGLPKPGTEIETDSLCNSYLTTPDGKSVGGSETIFSMPEWKVGDEFVLDIPSGTIRGKVETVRAYGAAESAEARSVASVFGGPQPSEEGVQLFVYGEWSGKEGGLLGGLFGYGRFGANLEQAVVVESSLVPKGKQVSYGGYSWAKSARHFLGIGDTEAAKLLAVVVEREERTSSGVENTTNQVFLTFAVAEVHLNPVLAIA
ncbi:MAG: hypothetical protein A3C08_00645 [Candidatus Taylorbacteria bacterium RIFCSPHIGHO2_02_FULL_47_18]|uniref:Uncharacterized protein n=1 Tax=Candidatus Taylorbacteria bacterium RIFCSPLOWO2_01_FULL_48_100 TaxID=1802322 RepID=A0A1G2NEQ9_9BACT|nr:MAG: hypothetical protein A2670_00635 [Candidatus Taylorbacteria bacterium RIFCSPHIGHO2_01_FULL_48_38]OHA27484.1 MAG: hypothetical protein A3C08_00645 [Candidatus Taylorbacteria bacterium RIFCSPHIGHO2_02_FULL_47_18]OHA34546.1 MAG: hypothetical protein A2938_03265 [Candidatus Taylorbacteria bacterium RIFCSPLOWO2_01_FULL_48_100]OHA40310.1 MAG: hypothetical protein A3J31_01740 [Candidatus Taylorbacteria bacterium RIFCSPLOWO2_02_FULL_48_16]OHA44971.1 MAG: hypothetical protein A3H13_03585 [Candid